MASVGVTIRSMPRKKKKGDEGGSDPKSRPGHPIFARVDDETAVGLERYFKERWPRPTLTALVQKLLKDFLRTEGFLKSGDLTEGETR